MSKRGGDVRRTERLTGDLPIIRDATPADLISLSSLRYGETPAVHTDPLHDAESGKIRYLVAELAEAIVGFGLLVLEYPSG
jgi:hypothetical protein